MCHATCQGRPRKTSSAPVLSSNETPWDFSSKTPSSKPIVVQRQAILNDVFTVRCQLFCITNPVSWFLLFSAKLRIEFGDFHLAMFAGRRGFPFFNWIKKGEYTGNMFANIWHSHAILVVGTPSSWMIISNILDNITTLTTYNHQLIN